MNRIRCFGFLLFLDLASGPVIAGTVSVPAKEPLITVPEPQRPWSVGFGYAPMLNLSADFRGLGGLSAANPLPALEPAVFGEYDDGFVHPDISGDTALTSYWSYRDNGQIDPAGGGFLDLSRSSVPGRVGVEEDGHAEAGFEIFVTREFGALELGGMPAIWGLKGRLHYAGIDLSNSTALAAATRRTTDSFPLDGVIPPLAPYSGSFTGPGPLLSTAATRTTVSQPDTATISGAREIRADLFTFGIGPWLAVEPVERLWIEIEAGLTVAVIDGDFSHFTRTTAPDGRSGVAAGSGGRTTALPGFHAGLSAIYRIDERWETFLHGRYQYLDDFTVRAGPASAELDFDGTFVLAAGIRYRF